METVDACGTGVDVQGVESAVVHDLEDVGVAADEEGRRSHEESAANGGIVVAGITSDVFDEYVGSLDSEAVYRWVAQADITSVDIAVYGTEGAESFELFGHLERTNVSGVPHLVALGKVPCVAFVPMAMSVREETDAFH